MNFTNKHNWNKPQQLSNRTYRCGFCNDKVSSDKGYKLAKNSDGSGTQMGGLFICPNCNGPTFFIGDKYRNPAVAFGNDVQHLPKELQLLYSEARRCTSYSCYTASVLLCRKALMNVAVSQGAKTNLKFIEYVDYLSKNHYIPPNGKGWVDHIRKKGNEATHEVCLMTESDAKDLINFIEMLLKIIYEFPSRIPNQERSNAKK